MIVRQHVNCHSANTDSGRSHALHVSGQSQHLISVASNSLKNSTKRSGLRVIAEGAVARTGCGEATCELRQSAQAHINHQSGVRVHGCVCGVVQRLLAAVPRVARQKAHARGDAPMCKGHPDVCTDACCCRDTCGPSFLPFAVK